MNDEYGFPVGILGEAYPNAKALNVATELAWAFYWGDTEEGIGFWLDIDERIMRIARTGR